MPAMLLFPVLPAADIARSAFILYFVCGLFAFAIPLCFVQNAFLKSQQGGCSSLYSQYDEEGNGCAHEKSAHYFTQGMLPQHHARRAHKARQQ